MRPSLSHFIRRILICLVIGAATTVAVAWIVAVTVRPMTSGHRRGGQTVWSRPSGIGDGWSYWAVHEFGTVVVARLRAHFEMRGELQDAYLEVRERLVPGWSGVHVVPPADDTGPQPLFVEDARGWPLVALRSEAQVVSQNSAPSLVTVHGGIVLASEPGSDYQRTVLPLRPIWSGCIIDTGFFSAIAFAVLYGPGMLKRAARRRGGRCERCGYDLRAATGAACPECGALNTRGEDAAG